MMKKSLRSTFFISTALPLVALAACATTAPGAHPDDMSAAKHHEAAQMHEGEAASHEAKHDPNATATRTRGNYGAARGGEGGETFSVVTYNPTEKHLGHAKEHRDYAQQHEQAAKVLEGFEEAECAAFPKETRVVCPLLGVVKRVDEIDDGARIHLSPDIRTDAVVAHMKCHAAFGRKMGRKGMAGCPMYLKGIEIKSGGEHAVDITAEEDAAVIQIRTRSKNHVSP